MQDELTKLTAYAGLLASMVIFIALGSAMPIQLAREWVSTSVQTAAVFFVPSITVNDIHNNYNSTNVAKPRGTTASASTTSAETINKSVVRILIVPGHQPDFGGTEYNGVYERNVVADIAQELAQLLAENPHYDVMVARGKTAWNPTLQIYFDAHVADIQAFIQTQKLQMASYVASGQFRVEPNQVEHNTTSSQGAIQLYGINKWTSENNIDITLHLHINDYNRRRNMTTYNGFAVYVPDRQYSNAEASKAIGTAIAGRLNAYHATSTLPKEDAGVVEDKELIATSAYNTIDGASVLIEYGYIYETQFQKPAVRNIAVTDYAYATYLGLQDFFKDPVLPTFGSVAFPYDWSKVVLTNGSSGAGVYALQAALHYLGYYPPVGKSFSDCPVSGVVGQCTVSALAAYQVVHGLKPTGTLGPQTRAQLDADLVAL